MRSCEVNTVPSPPGPGDGKMGRPRPRPRGHCYSDSYCPALICCHFDVQHVESHRWTDVEVSLAR